MAEDRRRAHEARVVESSAEDLWSLVGPPRSDGAAAAPRVGRVVEISDAGQPWLVFAEGEAPISARRTLQLSAEDVGREVLVLYEENDPRRPIVVGRLDPSPAEPAREVSVDGERVVIEGEREVVLRCGDATLTLTRDGRVVLRGEELLSRAAGRNKIKGAAVQIN